MSVINPLDAAQLLRTLLLHNRHVEGGLLLIRQELERRAHHHDDSKLTADEFGGFSRINAAAREFLYGSPEYRAGLDAEWPRSSCRSRSRDRSILVQ